MSLENQLKNAPPQAEDSPQKSKKEDIDSEKKKSETTVPIKFNKETRNLTLEEACALAQKGLKFETIEKDFAVLKELAQHHHLSVPVFLENLRKNCLEEKKNALVEKCGGNAEIAEHILNLEGTNSADDGLYELQEFFPSIKSAEDLPQRVTESAKLKGTLLLDEYLRYLLAEERLKKETAKAQRDADKSSIGSLSNRSGAGNPATEEFLKGIWQ